MTNGPGHYRYYQYAVNQAYERLVSERELNGKYGQDLRKTFKKEAKKEREAWRSGATVDSGIGCFVTAIALIGAAFLINSDPTWAMTTSFIVGVVIFWGVPVPGKLVLLRFVFPIGYYMLIYTYAETKPKFFFIVSCIAAAALVPVGIYLMCTEKSRSEKARLQRDKDRDATKYIISDYRQRVFRDLSSNLKANGYSDREIENAIKDLKQKTKDIIYHFEYTLDEAGNPNCVSVKTKVIDVN